MYTVTIKVKHRETIGQEYFLVSRTTVIKTEVPIIKGSTILYQGDRYRIPEDANIEIDGSAYLVEYDLYKLEMYGWSADVIASNFPEPQWVVTRSKICDVPDKKTKKSWLFF